MSRGLIWLSTLALLATPLVVLADSAEALAASLAELRDPGVIDPLDSDAGDDCLNLAATPGAHPLEKHAVSADASCESVRSSWVSFVDLPTNTPWSRTASLLAPTHERLRVLRI